MIRISHWRESYCRTNTSGRRKKDMQKSRTMWFTVRDTSRKVNHVNSTGSSVPSEKVNQSLCWTLKPKASKTMNKEQDVIDTGKRSMTPNKVKLV